MPAESIAPGGSPLAWPSRAGKMASVFFCECLRNDLGLDLLLDVHLAQPGVLGLQLFHPRNQRHVHAAVLRAPLVERRRADPQLSAKIRYRQPRLYALQRVHDLAIRESRLLHSVELPQRENSTSDLTGFSGGLPIGLALISHGLTALARITQATCLRQVCAAARGGQDASWQKGPSTARGLFAVCQHG